VLQTQVTGFVGTVQRSVFGTERNVSVTGSVSVLRPKGWDA
jgi:hypothetical protein